MDRVTSRSTPELLPATRQRQYPDVTGLVGGSPQHAPIRVDDDNDSSYGDDESDQASETAGPNDETAHDNLDLFHHIFTLTLNGSLFLAPITSTPNASSI
ncbi:hypothetical protein B0J14DRAFT_655478 [Halenospora varia]|nr:hypothetical protein B0J14DRAFT_655478 [Halenospora varia]